MNKPKKPGPRAKPAPYTGFDQREHVAGGQRNEAIAGSAKIVLGGKSKASSRPKATAKETPKAVRSRKTLPAASEPPSGGLGSLPQGLPNPLYVVFCRLAELNDLEAEDLAAAQQALIDVVKRRTEVAGNGVFHAQSSVYGRIVFAREMNDALRLAAGLLKTPRARALGFAWALRGETRRRSDLGRDALAGPAISLAARLAACTAATRSVLVEKEVLTEACRTKAWSGHFAGPKAVRGKVKATTFQYQKLLRPCPPKGPLVAVTGFSRCAPRTSWSTISPGSRRRELKPSAEWPRSWSPR